MASLAELVTRMNDLEGRLAAQEKINHDHMARFAFYYVTEHVKVIAIVSKIVKDKADLVVFNHGWSGGSDVMTEVPLFVLDHAFPEDEQIHTGKWVPAVDFPEIMLQALREAKVTDAESTAEAAAAS